LNYTVRETIFIIGLLMRESQAYFGEKRAEGGGIELEAFSRRKRSESLLPKSRAKSRDLAADAPLTDFADRVQYPLETPSKLGPPTPN
jgi:hypothetical protein